MHLKSRLDIPYIPNPGNACALASYAMVASYFFPEVTFDDIANISRWEPGYVVWAFPFWLWMMEQGVHITNYDLIDYEAWARDGIAGLKASIPEKEFKFYETNTKNLGAYTHDIAAVMQHSNFTYHRQKPTWDDLVHAHKSGAVCEVVLDACALDGHEGFSLHRVVILEITDSEIVFHDPRTENHRPARRETHEHFTRAWLESVAAPELCTYTLI